MVTIIFKAGQPNFPTNQDELNSRLKKIETLINNVAGIPTVNIEFTKAAFQLMKDCDLITESNLQFLTSSQACQRFNLNFKFPFNPEEGALRSVEYDGNVLGSDGQQWFYHGHKQHVELNRRHYLISNDWYADHSPYENKRAFYSWLKKIAQDACEEHWAEQKIVEVPITNASNDSTAPEETPKPEDLKVVLASLEELYKKIDKMNEKITFLYDELK